MKFSFILLFACAVWLSSGCASPSAIERSTADPAGETESEPLNVLFIAIDDLRPELGVYGSRAITPNIDRLAASGLLFDRAYTAQAVCGASRVALMTSVYPEYTGERSAHVVNWRNHHPELLTLNTLFRDNGFTTVGVGKVYHAWDGVDADIGNWDKWVNTQGFRYVNEDAEERAREMAAAVGKDYVRGPTTEIGVAANAEELYFDGWRAREGVRQLKRIAADDAPFFLAVGFSLPHLPFAAPKQYWDLYERESFAMPPNLGIPHGYPEYAANRFPGEMRNYADVPPGVNPREFSDAMNKRLIHGYLAAVSYTDRNVGLLLDALEASGEADRTIVVLWSDHGWKLGEHYSWCKHTNFEVDTRVPLIIHHPQMDSAKGRTDALVELIDLYPSLAALSGLDVPDYLHGKSFLPVLEDPGAGHRDYAYSSYPRRPDDDIVGHSIRNQRYRYTELWDAQTDALKARVLTDLIEDPGEESNVLSEHPDKAEKFSRDLKAIVRDARRL